MKNTLFQTVGKTRIIPISLKILTIFVSLLLLSNFATNFINLKLSQRHIINLNNTVMVSLLKDVYIAAGNQSQILAFSGDKKEAVSSIARTAKKGFSLPNSLAFAFDSDGNILFFVCANETSFYNNFDFLKNGNDGSGEFDFLGEEKKIDKNGKEIERVHPFETKFTDEIALESVVSALNDGVLDGSLSFSCKNGQYFGVYKYQSDWSCFFVRAEKRTDTLRSNAILFGQISIVILLMIVVFLVAGLFMLKKILLNIKRITESLYEMQRGQKLDLIDLSTSPNDDVSYLACSFNSLSGTINNLLGIFQKFASKDVVARAYEERQIRLEGNQRNLTMLFSDIKSFTYRTETLGNDIIDLLNVHYDRVIHAVHESDGVIGSIIGDAILAIFGTAEEGKHKSLFALESAWNITRVTAELRERMKARRREIEKTRVLSEAEERVYKAVLIDVGVGIDGGNVFYGNIGSDEHMTNTVIGDNVNSASRLEGLTRIYQLPVIVSEYVRDEVLQSQKELGAEKFVFFEIDTVQVKGKTEGKRIFFPLDSQHTTQNDIENFSIYENALFDYYKGNWNESRERFSKCEVPAKTVFLERMGNKNAPDGWSGIWTMQTK